MTTLNPENIQWLLEETSHAAQEPNARPLLYWHGMMTELAITLAVALRYPVKGGKA